MGYVLYPTNAKLETIVDRMGSAGLVFSEPLRDIQKALRPHRLSGPSLEPVESSSSVVAKHNDGRSDFVFCRAKAFPFPPNPSPHPIAKGRYRTGGQKAGLVAKVKLPIRKQAPSHRPEPQSHAAEHRRGRHRREP
jgi:hypothetical protein